MEKQCKRVAPLAQSFCMFQPDDADRAHHQDGPGDLGDLFSEPAFFTADPPQKFRLELNMKIIR